MSHHHIHVTSSYHIYVTSSYAKTHTHPFPVTRYWVCVCVCVRVCRCVYTHMHTRANEHTRIGVCIRTHTHTHTHAYTHVRARARTHTHTHTQPQVPRLNLVWCKYIFSDLLFLIYKLYFRCVCTNLGVMQFCAKNTHTVSLTNITHTLSLSYKKTHTYTSQKEKRIHTLSINLFFLLKKKKVVRDHGNFWVRKGVTNISAHGHHSCQPTAAVPPQGRGALWQVFYFLIFLFFIFSFLSFLSPFFHTNGRSFSSRSWCPLIVFFSFFPPFSSLSFSFFLFLFLFLFFFGIFFSLFFLG